MLRISHLYPFHRLWKSDGRRALFFLLIILGLSSPGYGQKGEGKVVLTDSVTLEASDIFLSSVTGLISLDYNDDDHTVHSVKFPLRKVSYILYSDETLDIFFEDQLPPPGPMPLGIPAGEFLLKKLPLSSEMYAFDGVVFPASMMDVNVGRHPEAATMFREGRKASAGGKTLMIAGAVSLASGGAVVIGKYLGHVHEELSQFEMRPKPDYTPGYVLAGAGLGAIIVGAIMKNYDDGGPHHSARLFNREVYRRHKATLEINFAGPAGPGIGLLIPF